jgi:hypothetical protein
MWKKYICWNLKWEIMTFPCKDYNDNLHYLVHYDVSMLQTFSLLCRNCSDVLEKCKFYKCAIALQIALLLKASNLDLPETNALAYFAGKFMPKLLFFHTNIKIWVILTLSVWYHSPIRKNICSNLKWAIMTMPFK